VREEFEGWRRNKFGRERIPERLWRAAVKLCREQSAYRIARWLRLNDAALRERVRRADARGSQRRPRVARAPRFLELEMVAAPGTSGALSLVPEYVLEARGVRVRVRGAPVAEVAALARALGTGTGTDEGEAPR
jgi:hypothetical protein